MFATTQRQPIATLAVRGIVTILTSSVSAPAEAVGQRIAIHAASKKPRTVWNDGTGRDPEPLGWDEGAPWDWIEATHYPGEGRFYWGGPLGAVVGSARLTACLPIVDYAQSEQMTFQPRPGDPEEWIEWDPMERSLTYLRDDGTYEGRDVHTHTDQLPFGDFSPGRWAWMLEDAAPVEDRCPNGCKRLDATDTYRTYDVSVDIGHGRWSGWSTCSVCDGDGRCDPIPATGHAGVWQLEADDE